MSMLRVRLLGLVLVTATGAASGLGQAVDSSRESPVQAALKDQAYPWYDPANDQVKPLLPDASTWTGWLQKRIDGFLDWLDGLSGKGADEPMRMSGRGLRGGFATFLLVAGGVFLLIMLWRLWRTYTPEGSSPDQPARIGDAARIAGLAPGFALEGMDAWAEALRLRAAGDAAGAVIWLFLDQLMSLQRAGLIRLLPGRTARQYACGLGDPVLSHGLRTTLGVFEQVYYGHRHPGPDELDRVWSQAELFRRRLQTLTAG